MTFPGRNATRRFVAALAFALALSSVAPAGDDVPPAEEVSAAAALAPRFQRWLEDVELLITETEREVFLALGQDYQRDHFVRRFWKVRDPFPRTTFNELREAWEAHVAVARQQYEELRGEAARMILYFGPPENQTRLQCGAVMSSIDVWFYPEGSGRIGNYFTLVFLGHPESAAYRLWNPNDGLRSLVLPGRGASIASRSEPTTSLTGSERELVRLIARECVRGDDILSALTTALDFAAVEDAVHPPPPGDEWVRSFLARSTDVPVGVEPLPGVLSLSFPGRRQSRTVVQGLVSIGRAAAAPTEGDRFYNLVLDGEVLRKGQLFDSFRYRFDFPTADAPELLPVVTQRYLRPGEYRLIVKVEDIGSKRVFREVRDLKVPVFDPAVHLAAAAASEAAEGPGVESAAEAGTVTYETRLVEANATIATGEHSIKIMSLPDLLMVGKLRVLARTRGEGIAKVAFELNGVEQLRKTKPPYSVEIELGPTPRFHTLKAVALDRDGRLLAVDEVLVNGGPHRFALRLLEPQAGQRYTRSLRVHAEVEVPEGERLDRVEIFLNETRMATLYQPPFEHPILLEGTSELAYVRAVAYLENGVTDEQVVFVNAPDFVDHYRVNFVELYTTVVDKKGEFLDDLRQVEVVVLEDDVEQKIRRFEKVRDMPINAGLVIDTSTSMMRVLRDVRRAAHRFLETVLTERDRAAVITFNDAPQLQVRFTSDPEVLAGGLVGLVAEGETALYDTIVYALHYFSGVRGKRAIILLTDGEDSSSTYSFDDTIEFARHTGVAIYIIGLGLPSEPQVRSLVRQLAHETGGETYFIDRVEQLSRVYDEIQLELRSQYLIAYQSSQMGRSNEFRRVEVVVDRRGVKAKTIHGYYP